ncbi:MAG: iron-sulfur cluster assembly protein [Prevotella sp.]|nr:iron-sulfur cluster assembly protein [Prevotella sp.]
MLSLEEKQDIEGRIVDVLKTVYDPEIPVDIYNLGLIYRIDVNDDAEVLIEMTFTAPTCPAAEFIVEDVRQKVSTLEGVNDARVELVFEPAWDKDMMSEEAKIDLGLN